MSGRRLGRYEVEESIGAGGMGVVYRARDMVLHRPVALKLLGEKLLADPVARVQLLQEARTASALNHPHICTIYEVGEDEGQFYIVMEYVEGQPLSALIPPDGLPAEVAIRYGVQVADALAHAHDRGIIHRDLKCSNVVITPEARAKVLDFGLAFRVTPPAEVSEETRSRTSMVDPAVAGTLHYIAPEILQGRPASAASDIWALGVLLYDAASGQLPFQGRTAFEISSAILRESPLTLPSRVPSGMRAVILTCLAKEPGQRYQRAGEVRAALQALHSHTEAMIAAATAAAGAATRKRAGRKIDSLAVLPFENAGADPDTEYLSDGITETLITNLSHVPRLRVMARSTVFRFKGRSADPKEAGRELNVGAVLAGRLVQRGDRITLGVELVDTATGARLWGEQYNRQMAEIFSLQEDIAREIFENLRVRLSGSQKQRVARRHTQDPEAYQLLLKGRYWCNKRTSEGLRKGIDYFHQALERDPSYALAYAGLADAFGLLAFYSTASPRDVMPKARAAAQKALEIDRTLAEAHASLALVTLYYDWDWAGAEKTLNRAIRQNPGYAPAYFWRAPQLSAQGRTGEALKQLDRAMELDPLSLGTMTGVGWVQYFARNYDAAIEQLRKALELDPHFTMAHIRLGQAYEQKGLYEAAIAEFQSCRAIVLLGHAYALAGRAQEARQIVRQLDELSARRYVDQYDVAAIHVALGDNAAALDALDRAAEQRSSWIVFLKADPRFDRLRGEPRYAQIVRRVGIP